MRGGWWQWDMMSPWRCGVTAHCACAKWACTCSGARFKMSSTNCRQKAIYWLTTAHINNVHILTADVMLFMKHHQVAYDNQVRLCIHLRAVRLSSGLRWEPAFVTFCPFRLGNMVNSMCESAEWAPHCCKPVRLPFSQPALSASVSKLLHYPEATSGEAETGCEFVAVTHVSLLKPLLTFSAKYSSSWMPFLLQTYDFYHKQLWEKKKKIFC